MMFGVWSKNERAMAYQKLIGVEPTRPVNVELWRCASGRRPPDLQMLVRERGGFDRIPAEDWRIFDRDMARWKERLGNGELHIPTRRRYSAH